MAVKKGKTGVERGVKEKYKNECKNSQRFVLVDVHNE
jgi:hypothetical protein